MAGMISFSSDSSEMRALGNRFEWVTEAVLRAEMLRGPVGDELKKQTPVAKKTIKGVEPGYLRDNIRSDVRAGAGSVALIYSTDVDYAGFIVDGTGPHAILPRDAAVLHWTDTDTGEEVFRRRVWHPGTQPNDFPGRTADEMLPLVESAFGTIFERF